MISCICRFCANEKLVLEPKFTGVNISFLHLRKMENQKLPSCLGKGEKVDNSDTTIDLFLHQDVEIAACG